MVEESRGIKASDIAEALKISKGRVLYILHAVLKMEKLIASWVPHLLSDAQKVNRLELSKQHLKRLEHDPKDFWRSFVTVDETCVHYYTPESRQASRSWTGPGEKPETRVRESK